MSAGRRTREFFARVLRRDGLTERAVLIRFLFVVEALLEEPAASAARVAQIRNALAAAQDLLAEAWRAGLDSAPDQRVTEVCDTAESGAGLDSGDRADVPDVGDIALSSAVTGGTRGCPRCPRAALSRGGVGDRDIPRMIGNPSPTPPACRCQGANGQVAAGVAADDTGVRRF